jgi:5-methylcytosine-specific restriction endonuclease McrA
MMKFDKARALLSNKNGKPSYEAVLEAALDEFLKDHDPEQREQRREERREKFESRTNTGNRVSKKAVQPHAARHDVSQTSGEDRSRHIPPSTRDAVFKRDEGRCTYVGPNGVRCGATHRLQIDHIVPYARGGSNAAANLRLLCERHNKQEAERVYGADKMKRFRARE